MASRVLTMVQPHLDVLSAAVVLLDDPVALLGDIDALLAQLPLELGTDAAVTPARSQGMALVADHGGKLRRALAGVGAVPDQLAQLGDAAHDETVRTELTLLAREACWQMRTLGREARRRWRNAADETYPAPMQQWLDRIDALVAAVNGVLPAAAVDGAADPAAQGPVPAQ
jgi:hypothetical protein